MKNIALTFTLLKRHMKDDLVHLRL